MVASDLVHSRVDTWGIVEAFISWKGRFPILLLRTRVNFRWVGLDIKEMLGHEVFGLYRYFAIRV